MWFDILCVDNYEYGIEEMGEEFGNWFFLLRNCFFKEGLIVNRKMLSELKGLKWMK